MAFTRTKLKGNLQTKRVTSAGDTIITKQTMGKVPLPITSANKLKYPGAFAWSDFTSTAFNASWTDTANFSTDSVESIWFRCTDSTTT
tara:strand:- start:425 stop:688 length:264 start_codon:yes stop_codon:yes gene_type:complete